MSALVLHEFHAARGAQFIEVSGCEAVSAYTSAEAEYEALTHRAAIIDLSFRGRVCLLGADREKFLHGQVTNDVQRLKVGEGCYAALVSAKGKIESDLLIYKLREEILLDFEPGLVERVCARLNKYVIAEDVQIVDVSAHYGLLCVCGPKACAVIEGTSWNLKAPQGVLSWSGTPHEAGDIYVMYNPRFGVPGYDLFVPNSVLQDLALSLEQSGRNMNAIWAGLDATETSRIENAVPLFGVDMSENTLPQEAEIQDRAISFAKGCYIGQEIIARIRTYGQVAKALRLLRFTTKSEHLPLPGTKLFAQGKEAGFVTSSAFSPKHGESVALAYVRKEHNSVGTTVEVGTAPSMSAEIVAIPAKF